jgi:putative ABC transport system permease protein
MHFSGIVFKNLLRRKLRSTLTCVGVAMAVATIIALIGFSRGLEKSSAEVYEGHGIDMVVVRAGVTQRLTSNLDQKLGDELARLPHVEAVNPSQTDMISFGEGSLVGIPVQGWPPGGFAMKGLTLVEGRQLTDSDRWGCLLGQSLVSTLHKKLGDEVEIELQKFRILGIFAGMNAYESMSGVVRLRDMQEIMDRPDQVTEFQIMLAPTLLDKKAAVEQLRTVIDSMRDPQGRRYGLSALPARKFVEGSTEMGLARAMAWGTSAIALLLGSLGMLNTMLMAVLERTHEIGILKALGWRESRIIGMIVAESLLLSLVGAVLGILFGTSFVWILSGTSWLGGLLRPEVSPAVIGLSIAMAMLMGAGGGLYPAWRAALLAPTMALRYE